MGEIKSIIWILALVFFILFSRRLPYSMLEDLIAFGIIYYIYKKNLAGKGWFKTARPVKMEMGLEEACRVLGVRVEDDLETVKEAYREKIAKNHPDKVNHLSKELRDKATEITMMINKAYEVVRRHKSI